MKRAARWLVTPLLVALLLGGLVPVRALDKQTRLDIMSSVVQISLVKIQGGQVYYLPWGSGTIISPDGLILTNCHVADPIRFGLGPDEVPDYDALGIGLTVRSDRPPQLSYLADVLQADPDLDLAVIRITRKTDQTALEPEDLNLPYVEVGDSDQLEVGDDLNVFGYPGIGGETVTFTRGVVSGFTLDAGIEGRAWIKTDASISGGNSGGTGVDESGMLIGVPTRAGVGGDTDPVDCRPVKDTNGDGSIDSDDDCVPIGGFINALRPVNLAKTLIEAARLGLPDTGRQSTSQPATGGGTAELSNLFFSKGANEFNQPTQIVSALPSGARSLYLFFDYAGMDSSRTFEMKVSIDGVEQPGWSLPASPWTGNEEGMWWIGWSDASFTNGTYELALYVDGEEQAAAQIDIGGTAQALPSFSNLVLGEAANAEGKAQEAAVLFPAGAKQIMAFFDYSNMARGTDWTRTWLMDGTEVVSRDETWSAAKSGSTSLTLTDQAGFEPGAYRLILTIDGELAALSNFWVTGAKGKGATFGPVTFASGMDRSGQPAGAAESFASGLEELHAFSAFSGMEDGIDVTVNWYIDEEKVVEWPYTWAAGPSGTWHDYLYSESGSLPDGEYMVELIVQGQSLQQGSTVIGSGSAGSSGTGPKPSDGVQIEGEIVDLDTNKPIPGALFIVLKPGITVDAFEWTDDEVYTMAEADQQGFYSLPDLLARGECYSMIIGAEDYWTYGEDDVCIDEDAESPLVLTVSLEKQ